jgi:hypothetical protein
MYDVCYNIIAVLVFAGRALMIQGSGLSTSQVSRASKLLLHGLCNYIGASQSPAFAHRALYFEAWSVFRTLVIKILERFLKCHREYCRMKSDNVPAFSFPQVKVRWAAQKKIDQEIIIFRQVVDYGLKQIARNRLDIGTLLPKNVDELRTWVADGTLGLGSVSDMLVIKYASELSLIADSRKKLYAQRLGGLDVCILNIHYPGWGGYENLDASTNVSCLHEWLHSELEPSAELIATVKELEEHVSVIKESYCRAQHVQDQALYDLGVLASLQRNPGPVDLHWTPYGINAVHPELGAFSSPSGAWWTVFPQIRRRERRACLDGMDLANRSTLKDLRYKRVRFQDSV